MKERVVLAYSGGLDTTVAVHWLKEKRNLEVLAVAVDVGQLEDVQIVRGRALAAGAVEAVAVDAVDEFAEEFILPALHANALYQGKYPLVSALSRPLICRHLAKAARDHGAAYAAHGCTGKGNDQVRFEVSLAALVPDLKVLAPVREWGMSRETALRYGQAAGLPVSRERRSPYSIDENLWGRTIECGELEDPWVEPPEEVWERTVSPAAAPREPAYIQLGFDEGRPVRLDGEHFSLPDLIRQLEKAAGDYGFGRIDMIEDRVVGIKSREVYETPGALALIAAHIDLEELTLEREVLRTKRLLEQRYAELAYEGYWFSPLREALDAFNLETAHSVSGEVRLKLTPGDVFVAGRRSPSSLYDYSLATYDEEDEFEHSAGEGFAHIWGMPLRIWARLSRRSHG